LSVWFPPLIEGLQEKQCVITRGRGEVPQVPHHLLPGSYVKHSWYFHRTRDLFLCYSHRNRRQFNGIGQLKTFWNSALALGRWSALLRWRGWPVLSCLKNLSFPGWVGGWFFFCLAFAKVAISTKSSALCYLVALQTLQGANISIL